MHKMVANTWFDNTPAKKAPSAVDNIVIIDIDSPDDDTIIVKDCKLEPDDVAVIDVEDTVQTDGLA